MKKIDSHQFEGTWYEAARSNNYPERGLTRESVTFKALSKNRWMVIHRGWRNEAGAWEENAVKTRPLLGKFPPQGTLVGMFGYPIPSAVHIVSIDKTYRYALLCGTNSHDFWILSKDENPSEKMISELLAEAKTKGFPIEEALFLQYR